MIEFSGDISSDIVSKSIRNNSKFMGYIFFLIGITGVIFGIIARVLNWGDWIF